MIYSQHCNLIQNIFIAVKSSVLCLIIYVVQLLSRVRLSATPQRGGAFAARQASLSFTMSWSLLKLMSIELVMPSNYLILCRPLLLLPSIFPSIIKVAIVIFSSVAQLWPTLCEPMACSTPGFPVHHQLTELAQTHVRRVGDAIQSSHSLLPPSPPAFNLSQHEDLFQ